jgi:hypothetical protein
MNMRLRLLILGGLIAVALTARPSYAILIASDSFDYAPGNLAGQNGGTGFNVGWTSTGGTAQVQTPGLTYPALNTVGNKAFISASNQNWRTLTAGGQGTGDSTLWISFIGQRTGANNIRFFGVSFYGGDVATAANERLTIGENSTNSNDTWGAHFTSAAGGRVEVAGAPVNTQSLLLARIDYHAAANDDFYLWVNPNLSLGEPSIGTAGASSVGAFNLAFDRLSLRAGTSNGGNIGEAIYDELRLATTFADLAGTVCNLGDTDCDGDADLFDFEAIRSHFRKTVTMRSDGDLVSNGVVDFADFHEWKTAFLSGGGSMEGVALNFSDAPEPTAIVCLLSGVFILTGASRTGRRRHTQNPNSYRKHY